MNMNDMVLVSVDDHMVDLGFRSSERLKKEGTDTVTVLDLASKIATWSR